MKIIDKDIYQAATDLVKEHGPAKALVEAEKNLQIMKERQDRDSAYRWTKIKDAIIELNDLDSTGHKIQ